MQFLLLDHRVSPWVPLKKPVVTPSKKVLKEIATHLNKANKITIFTGIGAADAHQSLLDVCEKLKSPVVHTL